MMRKSVSERWGRNGASFNTCGKTYIGKDAEDLFAAAFASTYYRVDNCELNIEKIKKEAIR